MKTFVTIFFVVLGHFCTLLSQCSPAVALDCENAPVFCSLDEVNGYTCANPDFVNPTGPIPLCLGTGVSHNTNWWAFVGNGEFINMVFAFEQSDCVNGDKSCSGIQLGIIDDCGGDPLDCNADCNRSTTTLSGYTENCHTYYVWIDGCCSDVCNYTIEVESGSPNSLPDNLPIPYVTNDACLCTTARICVEQPTKKCAASKSWAVDGILHPNSYNQSCIDIEIPSVIVPIEVCVTHTIGNPRNPNFICDQATSCFSFLPDTLIKNINEGALFVCWEDHYEKGYNWNDTIIYNSCINPPCKTRKKENEIDCCANYEAQIQLLPNKSSSKLYEFIGNKNQLPFVTEDGKEWYSDLCNEPIIWHDSNNFNCDTGYNLFLSIYNPDIQLTRSCGSCNDKVIITANILSEFDCSFGVLNIEKTWLNKNLDTMGKDNILSTSQEGTFYFTLDVSFTDTISNKKYTSNLQDSSWHIYIDQKDLEIMGETILCAPDTAVFSLSSAYKNKCGKANWSIKRGEGEIIEPDSTDNSEIKVVWDKNNNTVGVICVEVLNTCFEIEDTCLQVQLYQPTILDYNFDENICGLSIDIDKTIIEQDEQWTFVSGSGSVNINHFISTTNIEVDEYGTYFFRLIANNGGCENIDTIYKFTFVRVPAWENVTFICDQEKIKYRILFDALGVPNSLVAQDSSGWFASPIGNHQFITPWIKNAEYVYITLIDSFNCPSIVLDTFYNCIKVAVDGYQPDAFSIYPNPAHDYIQITNDNLDNKLNEMDIRIIDIQGHEILTPPKTGISGGIKVNIDGLASGMYFIQLKKGDKNEVVKFVKI